MIFNNPELGAKGNGYIAGTVTVQGTPAVRDVLLFESNMRAVYARSQSLRDGQYMFIGLDADKKYLVMAKDYQSADGSEPYNPFAWDFIEPATDLTFAEQIEKWQSHQQV